MGCGYIQIRPGGSYNPSYAAVQQAQQAQIAAFEQNALYPPPGDIRNPAYIAPRF